jgi:hypothetical protein
MTSRLLMATKVLMVWTGWMATMSWMALRARIINRLRRQRKSDLHLPTVQPTLSAIASFPSLGLHRNLPLTHPIQTGDPSNLAILLPRCITTRANPHFPPTKTRARLALPTLPLQLLPPFPLQLRLPLLPSLIAQISTLVLEINLSLVPIQLSRLSTP